MWQLQLNGFEMRLSEVRLVSSSKAPGVTQLIWLPKRLRLCRLLRPLNIARLTVLIWFSASRLEGRVRVRASRVWCQQRPPPDRKRNKK
jgi:hypothetical protein